jgi:prepilin-type N-terminal cleavage/methylation domain-containing protein
MRGEKGMTRRAGFSLIEVLVASAILAACIIPVVVFAQRNLTESAVTQEEILGRQILMDLCERYKTSHPMELERVRDDPSLILRDRLLQPLNVASQSVAASARAQVGALDLQRRVYFERNFNGIDGIHRVRFEVSWNSRRGWRQVASLSRLIHVHL